LRELSYPNYEVIVVNDGSTDNTRRILDYLLADNSSWLRVMHLNPNGGKAMALNWATLSAKGDYIVVMDADCFLDKDALQFLVAHFLSSDKVGAITGNPRVRNRTTLLGKIQVGEYSYIIGLIKRAQRVYGKILTVSGAIAAYRKKALFDVGLFDPDTVTEDIDITWKLHRRFWDVRYEPRALCWVLVPETIKGLWGQRVRWAQGGIEVVRKHVGILFKARYRRLWPVYIEYVLGTLWAHAFAFIFLFLSANWIASYLAWSYSYPSFVETFRATSHHMIPGWTGTRSVIAMLCFGQFLVSLVMDFRYEKQISVAKIYFWIIWYPAIYWVINALACISAVYRLLTRRSKICVAWKSPDRGIHTLRSSIGRN
jgi:biofilm PGA synthesis N-glycosyltransferase PgaC